MNKDSRPSNCWKELVQDTENISCLLFGHNGYIGGQLLGLMRSAGYHVNCSTSRMENRDSVLKEIKSKSINMVIIAAGLTHGKEKHEGNIDYCEGHRCETIRANVLGTLTIVDLCHLQGIHCTVFATGCIYDYAHLDPTSSLVNQGFTELDKPNYSSSFYSLSKLWTEDIMREYLKEDSKLLILRVRMPISADFHERSLITKLINYAKVINIPNSVSILTDLLPLAIVMANKSATGIYNFTNEGTIKHEDILSLYKTHINPSHSYDIIGVEELKKILKTSRCNNKLNSSKLIAWCAEHGMTLPSASEGLQETFQSLKEQNA